MSWKAVLGYAPGNTLADLKKKYKSRALERHPNKGGSEENFKRLGAAWDDAQLAMQLNAESPPNRPRKPQPSGPARNWTYEPPTTAGRTYGFGFDTPVYDFYEAGRPTAAQVRTLVAVVREYLSVVATVKWSQQLPVLLPRLKPGFVKYKYRGYKAPRVNYGSPDGHLYSTFTFHAREADGVHVFVEHAFGWRIAFAVAGCVLELSSTGYDVVHRDECFPAEAYAEAERILEPFRRAEEDLRAQANARWKAEAAEEYAREQARKKVENEASARARATATAESVVEELVAAMKIRAGAIVYTHLGGKIRMLYEHPYYRGRGNPTIKFTAFYKLHPAPGNDSTNYTVLKTGMLRFKEGVLHGREYDLMVKAAVDRYNKYVKFGNRAPTPPRNRPVNRPPNRAPTPPRNRPVNRPPNRAPTPPRNRPVNRPPNRAPTPPRNRPVNRPPNRAPTPPRNRPANRPGKAAKPRVSRAHVPYPDRAASILAAADRGGHKLMAASRSRLASIRNTRATDLVEKDKKLIRDSERRMGLF